jgi:DNA-binding IclR family transcriptional regulator
VEIVLQEDPREGVQASTLDRALAILQLFTIDRPRWTVESAANALGYKTSTTYRYFKSLARAGLLVIHAHGEYVLGPAIIEMDRTTRHLDPLIQVARPIMRQVATSVDAPFIVLLCRLYRDSVICVAQDFDTVCPFNVSYERGRPLSLFRGASSKIILANLPRKKVERTYRYFQKPIQEAGLGATLKELRKRLGLIRKAGYSISYGELDAGLEGIAAPVFGPDSIVLASISVVIQAVDRADVEQFLLKRLLIAAQEIHNDLLQKDLANTIASGTPGKAPTS